jgi:putative hemolysin
MLLSTAIILLVLCLIFSAFFSGSEVAIVSTSELKARHYLDQKLAGAKALYTLKERQNEVLITILIGNNIVNTGASAIATVLAIGFFDDAGLGIATGAMTLLLLTFGEITPKSLGSKHAKPVALFVAPIILFLMRLLMPLVFLFHQLTRFLDKAFKGKNDPVITEQELRHIVNVGEEEGQIKKEEKEMIHRIFRFDDTEVQDIMTPRTDVFRLDWRMTIKEALPSVTEQEYSRIPVYDRIIDKIKGIVFTRDILDAVNQGKTDLKLKDIAKPVLYVPKNKKIDKLLKELQRKKLHLAVVVNEHGGVEGLVTIEDILEEIVGEIFDEADDVERLIHPKSDAKGDYWEVHGKTPITLLDKELGLEIPDEDEYNTIAGFLQHTYGRIPEQGERFNVKQYGIEIIITKAEGPVVLEMYIRKNPDHVQRF